MTEKTGTFVVTHAESESAVVRDVDTAQVHTLSSNPGVEVHDVIEATVAPDPPLSVTWKVVEVDERRTIDLVDSDLEPTRQSVEAAGEADVGDLVRTERAGAGEIHVLSLPPAETESAARDVLEDVETVARAARLGAVRVEVRRSPEEGVLSVRYLPD
ncbi:DUF5812 family protein [Salinilacihabitans rarus]|uniref:DUF5812 family protein n=1 Tax=Salinilacihabitans rarus TaxID=2961596 RepID=UPI0020C8E51F|nr:DUF5812 family protein [Salinilacihabitans rarus]